MTPFDPELMNEWAFSGPSQTLPYILALLTWIDSVEGLANSEFIKENRIVRQGRILTDLASIEPRFPVVRAP